MRYDSKLTLFRALRPINISSAYTSSYDLIQEAEAFALKFAKEYLDNLASGIRNDGLEVTTELSRGTPAREILKYVDQNGLDLIVMTARGHSGLTKWLMGSVASKVLNGANIRILLIRMIKN
jgi:nucleotide-binding universal stress UspA family protein